MVIVVMMPPSSATKGPMISMYPSEPLFAAKKKEKEKKSLCYISFHRLVEEKKGKKGM